MRLRHVGALGARFHDRYERKASDWLKPWTADVANFDLAVLGVPLSKTSISHSGAHLFPDAVRSALRSYTTYSIEADIDITDYVAAVDLGDVESHVTDLARVHRNIREAATDYWAESDKLLCTIGGDHSITAPLVEGLTTATGANLGIIHFDAHHDMRNLLDGGATNGTPFRTLLESGVVRGNQLVQIGLRDFANARAYTEYARNHDVTLITARQVRQIGMTEVLKAARRQLSGQGRPLYISFDLDVLDQAYAPGVPAPGPGGLDIWDAFTALEQLLELENVMGFDMVCADPTVDTRNLTARVAANIFLRAALGLAKRKREEQKENAFHD